MYVYIYIYRHTDTCIHICACTDMCIHTYRRSHTQRMCLCWRMCVCVCAFMCVSLCRYRNRYSHIGVYIDTDTCIYVHTHLCICVYIHARAAYPTWRDIFECCFKAQSSKFERLFCHVSVKRDVRASSFEL